MSCAPSCKSLLWCFSLLAALNSGCGLAAVGQNTEGVRLFERGQYQAAMYQFQRAAASDPYNADAYYNMASTFHKLGTAQNDKDQLAQAEGLYNQCLDYDENHVDCHRGLAVLLHDMGRDEDALALLKNWVMRGPHVADARIELARIYQELGETETAQIQLHQASQIDPQNPRVWKSLAHLREQNGDLDLALANYQRAYSLDPFQPMVAQRIASLQRTAGSGSSTGRDTRLVEGSGGWSPRY